jgi:dipeptidase E
MMKKLFLASYFADVSKHLPVFTGGNCSGKTVTFIPTASIVEKVNFYVGAAKKALEKLGLITDELDVSKASKDEIKTKLAGNDYIFISGGNTFYLLQELKRTGADQMIVEQIGKGKIYIGDSAGSIVTSPNIEHVELMDDKKAAETLTNYQGLGVVDFYPVPHHTNLPFKKAVEKILLQYGNVMDLRPMSNKQAITVYGDKVELIG